MSTVAVRASHRLADVLDRPESGPGLSHVAASTKPRSIPVERDGGSRT